MIDGSGDRRQAPRRAGAGGTGRVIGKEKSTTETRRHFAFAEPKKLKNQLGAHGIVWHSRPRPRLVTGEGAGTTGFSPAFGKREPASEILSASGRTCPRTGR